MTYTGRCPHCGAAVRGGHGTPMKRIGSPIMTCHCCHKNYIDENMYEWSVISPSYKFHYCFFANNRGYPILFLLLFSLIRPIPCLILLLIWIAGCGVYVHHTIKNKIEASTARTSDPIYLGILILIGYEKLDEKVISDYLQKYGRPEDVCGLSGRDQR